MKIKLSKSQWEEMGKKAGWMKAAKNEDIGFKYKLIDLKTYEVLDTQWMTHSEHVTRNRSLSDNGNNQRWDRVQKHEE